MRIYVHSENTVRAGQVARLETGAVDANGRPTIDVQGYPTSPDVTLWGDGEPKALVEQARADLGAPDAANTFRRACARAVLDELSAYTDERAVRPQNYERR